MQIPIVENVLKLNDEVAQLNREQFDAASVWVVDLIGGPGCGKTTLLEATLQALKGEFAVGVLVGDLTTSRDADRLARGTDQVAQINTGQACHLDANQVRQAMRYVDLQSLDVLVIENVGNLICPVGFDLGQHAKVGMFSVAEGADKAAKHPRLVQMADALVLNKIDMLGAQPFDRNGFEADVFRLHPEVVIADVAALRGQIEPWLNWLRQQVHAHHPPIPTGSSIVTPHA